LETPDRDTWLAIVLLSCWTLKTLCDHCRATRARLADAVLPSPIIYQRGYRCGVEEHLFRLLLLGQLDQ
jgi:hypothetical protein